MILKNKTMSIKIIDKLLAIYLEEFFDIHNYFLTNLRTSFLMIS